MKAVIYARYSSDNQREESIEGQIRECTAFAEKNDITVLKHYIDRAYSARTDHRPAFQEMIKAFPRVSGGDLSAELCERMAQDFSPRKRGDILCPTFEFTMLHVKMKIKPHSCTEFIEVCVRLLFERTG